MKTFLRYLTRLTIILLVLPALLLLVMLAAYLLADRTNGTLLTSGGQRSYLIHVPETYDPATPTPLVISIHGLVQWPAHQAQMTRWNDLADRYGFILVYPSGTGFPKRWRTSPEPGSAGLPDVAFISDLLDELESDYNLDPARIYVNGLSNGAGMTFLLSCELSGRIAAIGTVAGAYTTPWADCHPSRPVPAIVFHGTADPIVPYHGGPSHRSGWTLPDIPTWVATLAQSNGCTADPLEIPASGAVSGIHYGTCAQGADVIFYTVAGGGHSWPGGEPLPEFIAGSTTRDIDATSVMWTFFQNHPLPEE